MLRLLGVYCIGFGIFGSNKKPPFLDGNQSWYVDGEKSHQEYLLVIAI